MAKNWKIMVDCMLDPMTGKLDLAASKTGTIVLDSSCEEAAWEFPELPAAANPDLEFEGAVYPPGATVSVAKNTVKLTWPTGGVGPDPWFRKHTIAVHRMVGSARIEDQYLAVTSGSVVHVTRGGVDVPHLVLAAEPQVTWDFSGYTPAPTKVAFEFTDEKGNKTPTGPFSTIVQVGAQWIGTWDAKTYGHYDYDICVDDGSLVAQFKLTGTLIDPAIDYLPPPASWPFLPDDEEEGIPLKAVSGRRVGT